MHHPSHIPVLLDRVLTLLAPALDEPPALLVDATLGLGGHTEAALDRFPRCAVVGMDRDPDALAHARRRLERFGDRVTVAHAVFDEIPAVLADHGTRRAQGILFDLGVSSMQLDSTGRGFSYAHDAPLDMRMDPRGAVTAAEVLNTYSVAALTRVLSEYGEERFARRIAQRIVRERDAEPFRSSTQLVEAIRAAVPAPARRTGGHPAKRTFQALRIEVNDELGALRRALPLAVDALSVGGRIVVLSYHSLEDRLVKRCLTDRATSTAPVDLPVVPPEHEPQLRLLTRGAEKATAAEVAANPRAASVRLRAAERLKEVA